MCYIYIPVLYLYTLYILAAGTQVLCILVYLYTKKNKHIGNFEKNITAHKHSYSLI